ncbi:MAG: hypothetical protein ACTSPV_17765, partial [Candidatus Hodarchaeales archaeon]
HKVKSDGEGSFHVNYDEGFQIISVKIDGKIYRGFSDNNVTTLPGIHSYEIKYSLRNNDGDNLPDKFDILPDFNNYFLVVLIAFIYSNIMIVPIFIKSKLSGADN